jgi:alpha-amylase
LGNWQPKKALPFFELNHYYGMRRVSLCFNIHQPYRLNQFPFFEIGKGKEYFDDHLNCSIFQRESKHYLAINEVLLSLMLKYPKKFNVNFCVSGTALDQAVKYQPKLIQSFQELFETGGVEFIGTTYSNSLAGLSSRSEFAHQVNTHSKIIRSLFGKSPTTFKISKLVYTDAIGEILHDFGFDKILLEGTDTHQDNGIYSMYRSLLHPGLLILINNHGFSDQINSHFGEFDQGNLTGESEKFVEQLLSGPAQNGPVNLGLNYHQLGVHLTNGLDIRGFLKTLALKLIDSKIEPVKISDLENRKIQGFLLASPNSLCSLKEMQEEMMSYLGNEMQREAFYTLYEIEDSVISYADSDLLTDWIYLQSSDHFYYMNTNQLTNENKKVKLSPYQSPFSAFINYMNVLSDFKGRLKNLSKTQGKSFGNMQPNQEKILESPLLNEKNITDSVVSK